MAREMAEQPVVLDRLIARSPKVRDQVRAVMPAVVAGSALLARGSSDNAALFGRYLIELASGKPAGLVAPSVHTRFHADVDYSGYVVVALSQSGRTPEVVETARALRSAGATVVSVVNGLDNPLAAECDIAVDLGAGPEEAVPSTKAVTVQMAVLVVIAAAFPETRVDIGALGGLPDTVADLLAHPEPVDNLARGWYTYDKLVVASRGLSVSAAHETALKVRECAQVFAEGYSCADLLHGPIAALGPSTPTLLIDDGGAAGADLDAVRDRLVAGAVPVAMLSGRRSATVPVPGALAEILHPICAVVRGQQLALSLSRERGIDPDRPVGLEKVTLTR